MTPSVHAIVGATVLAGRDLEPVRAGVVIIEGAKITAVGPRRDVSIPKGAEVVHAAGLTVLPGFIDAHVHIGFYEPHDVVAGGVTTVRDLGWPPERIFRVVAASRDDDFPGPTIVAAGPMLTAVGGYPTRAAWAPDGTGVEISSAADARAVVGSVADAGSCIVKIALNPPVGPVLESEVLSAITDEAHARGLKVTGHIHGLDQLEKALDAGVDELAHMLMSREAIPPEILARMVAAGTVVVPTLSIFSGRAREIAVANLRAFLAAGGRTVYGTDLGNEGPLPGIDPKEISSMHEAGMSGQEIIRSATSAAADWLGLPSAGAIAHGLDADVIVVEGDPLDDVSSLTRVVRVWRRGRPVTRGS